MSGPSKASERGARPRYRVVLLGASNLTISFRRIVGLARAGLEGEVDVYAAHGHGRSYGVRSRIPGRELPGLAECGLWSDVAAAPSPEAKTLVLVTDVGNDLIYGRQPEQLLGWVETCLERLASEHTEFVLTRLPLARMATLTRTHYRIFVRLLFPSCNATYEEITERAQAVDAGLVDLAAKYAAPTVTPPAEWYGRLDPIHILPADRQSAWCEILSKWPSLALPESGRAKHVFGPWAWLSQRPEERTLLGFPQTARQPILDRHGLRLHLY